MTVYVPTRGRFHRRNERGGAQLKVDGADGQPHQCAFCERTFVSPDGVRSHEHSVHKKKAHQVPPPQMTFTLGDLWPKDKGIK